EKLNGIIEWPGAITAIPGHTSWFLGLYRNRDQNVQVVDLAHIVAPANRTQSSSENSRQEPKFILLADDGRLGIVTNAMSTVLTLHADDIHWQNDGPVAFVSGTVKEKMCSIIDIDKLVAHLNEDLGQ
ncbi:chemotaxis protein CheW, partial [Kaarinaea lacus]